jgi:hydroxypyruvate isomerase
VVALRYDVNVSILLTELPLLQRPQAARDAGFSAVEAWWPFATAVPGDREVDAFVGAVRDAGVRLVSLNAYGGDMASGERGVASLPGREAEFRDNLDVAVAVAQALDCPTLHVLYGNRDGSDPDHQDELAVEHLRLAVSATAGIGAGVVVEALSGDERYPVRTAADALHVLDRVGPGARLLCDVYHLSVNGEDPVAVIRRSADRIGHVQVADAPGRHQPGTGTVDVDGCLRALEDAGYTGWVGLEYTPLGPSAESFGWLPRERRGAG